MIIKYVKTRNIKYLINNNNEPASHLVQINYHHNIQINYNLQNLRAIQVCLLLIAHIFALSNNHLNLKYK